MKIDITVEPVSDEVAAELSILMHLIVGVKLALVRIEWTRQVIGPPARYDYKIVTQDGRDWSQDILFDSATDPGMTFDVPGYWRESAEFAPLRPLRAKLIDMTRRFGITRIEAVWT
jgi:hypothetical protein